MTGRAPDGVDEDFTAILGRAIDYRVGSPGKLPRWPRYPVTGYVLGTPVGSGDGWYLVALVFDASLSRSRLRVWWHEPTRAAAIDRADSPGTEPLP
jgi:hypothetical protein